MRNNNKTKNQSHPIIQMDLSFVSSVRAGKLKIKQFYLTFEINYRLIALVFLAIMQLRI